MAGFPRVHIGLGSHCFLWIMQGSAGLNKFLKVSLGISIFYALRNKKKIRTHVNTPATVKLAIAE